MFVLKIAPLVAIPKNQSQILTYIFKTTLPIGSLIEVPLRNRKVPAIVLGSESLRKAKLELKKQSDFSVKPISRVIFDKPLLNPLQIKTAFWLSDFYAAPLGLVLRHVLPPFWSIKRYQQSAQTPLIKAPSRETQVIPTLNFKNHYKNYQKEIRKHLKNKKQVLLLVPETSYFDYFLAPYAEFNPIIVHSGLKNKDYAKIWSKIQDNAPQLIIGTRNALFLPFNSLGLIIIDDLPHEMYQSDSTPRYQAPTLAQYLAQIYRADCIANASFPSVALFHRQKADWFVPNLDKKIKIIDMVREFGASFSILSREIQDLLLKNVQIGAQTILFVPRKGYAPSLVCQKCGQAKKCPHCQAFLVVHQNDLQKDLRCHHCQYQDKIPRLCDNCGRYELKPRGIGARRVNEAILQLFKHRTESAPSIFVLNRDSATSAEGRAIVATFNKTPGAILIASPIIFSYKYLLEGLDIGILNADALTPFIDFKTELRVAQAIYNLALMAKRLVVQAFNPQHPAITAIATNNSDIFLREELTLRKNFGYPPFVHLTRLILHHPNKAKGQIEAQVIYQKLNRIITTGGFKIKLYPPVPGSIAQERGQYLWEILLKIPLPRPGYVSPEQIRERNQILRYLPSRGWQIKL